jgi:tagatose 1,6-diphosphate aldolase
MSVTLTPGKWTGLKTLADKHGCFRMMAIDQRGSMEKALGKALKKDAKQVAYEEMSLIKQVITRVLCTLSTATLTDPIFGLPDSLPVIPRDVGFLLALEATGYQEAGDGKERRTTLLEKWSVEKIKRSGATAVKLLVYFHPDTSKETLAHQYGIVRQVGAECAKHDILFLLELVGYPLKGMAQDSTDFAKEKPTIVIRSAKEFSKPEYGVDILKLEFPAELKYTKEFAGKFDKKERTPAYTLKEVEGFCKQVDEACLVPWVILSAGVDIDEFVENVKLAKAAGASGFLCGRAIWKEAVNCMPDVKAVEQFLETTGVANFRKCHEALKGARPWHEHKKFGGLKNVAVAQRGPNWHREY